MGAKEILNGLTNIIRSVGESGAEPCSITDACDACGACANSCPIGCISMGAYKYEIDAGSCAGCGICMDLCPAGAIVQG